MLGTGAVGASEIGSAIPMQPALSLPCLSFPSLEKTENSLSPRAFLSCHSELWSTTSLSEARPTVTRRDDARTAVSEASLVTGSSSHVRAVVAVRVWAAEAVSVPQLEAQHTEAHCPPSGLLCFTGSFFVF